MKPRPTRQLFRIGADVLNALSVEEVEATFNDMKELGLASPPYKEFDIETPAWAWVSLISKNVASVDKKIEELKKHKHEIELQGGDEKATNQFLQTLTKARENVAEDMKEFDQLIEKTKLRNAVFVSSFTVCDDGSVFEKSSISVNNRNEPLVKDESKGEKRALYMAFLVLLAMMLVLVWVGFEAWDATLESHRAQVAPYVRQIEQHGGKD